jgi:nucleoside-diphosphate-sugar epimerase
MGEMILVTGANGFIGSRVIQRLCAGGRNVMATGRRAREPGALPPGCEYVRADLSDPAAVEALSARGPFKTQIHLASLATFQDDADANREMYRSNVTSTFHLLEMARRHGSRMVFLSTGMVYGDQPGPFREDMPCKPGNFYALSKLMGEEMVRGYALRYGLGHLIFRAGIIYGPGQAEGMFIPTLAAALSEGKDFPMTEGRQVRDFLYVGDCVRAVELAAAGALEGTYNLGGGARHTMREVAEMTADIVNARDKLKLGALEYRPNELWEYYLDIGRIKADLEWRPEVEIKDGMERMLRHALSKRM